ncbi:MAG: hypothetical protein HRT61_19290, partial [Ekhidna sp.]|nr:hypothetical protein [Ekhidna sp.]
MNNPRSQILLKLQNFVVVFFILCYSATSQIAQYKFHRLNENQGLANGFINQIKQDTLGFMWIASNDGLYRFDGSQFKSYRTTTINAIPNNTTNDLLVDSRNNVYVATDNGLAVYSNELDSIIHYLPNEVFGSNAENVITSLTSSDRAIYLGTSGSGVYKFESGILSKVSFGKDTTYTNFRDISDLKFRGNTLWAASWTRGLLRHNIVNGKTDIVTSMDVAGNSSNISELFIDSFDRVWLGTNRGVFTAVNNTDGISLEPFDNLTASEVDALSIYEDREGIIWVGTRNDGLFKIGNDEVVHFVPKRDGSSVSHRTISSIEQDSNGNLWLGTHNNGIDVFDPAGEIVSNINPVKYDQTNDYLSESVWGIHESDNGIWLGTDGSGLYHYNQTTAEVERIASSKSKLRLTDDAVLSIEVAYDQKIWVGTYNGGINILDTRMDAVQYFNMANSSLSTNDIRVLFEDQQKTMWIGTNRGGLYSYNDADQLNPIAGTQSLDIRGIIEDQDQMLWLATYGDGLVKYNPKNNKLEYFDWTSDLPNQQPIALSINLIDHYVLVATMQSGLVRFDTEDQSFDRFDEINGIINNTVRAIHPEQSTIWMSTNTGLSVLDLSDGEIRNFDSFDGLQKGHYNDGSFVRDANGRFFFGGIHGLDFFNPQELLTNQYFPKVTFTSLKIDNEIIRPNASTSIEASMPIVNEITLLPDQDVITIGFNVIAFPNALGWSFEYLLDGFDETWTTGTKNNDATYRNIPPGNYTFTVRAVDHVGGRTGQVSTIGIKVLPPWWRTIYAYIGFVAVLIFLAWVIYRNVKERISMRQKLFYEQKLRHQEFETMQDKIRFYTNFSHEMKTPISLISGPVNDLLRSTEIPERSKKSLRLIKRNSQSLLKLVNRLLEFRKIETKNTALNVGYHDLTILAQEEAESFSYLAKDRDVKFGFYCETDLKAWIDIEKFQIIINNLLLNALKYSEPSTKVTFKVLHEAPSIVAIISDEGRGIAKEELQHIFTPFYQARNSIGTGGTGIGLALCKSFVELHGGTIEVESSLGQGSTFKLTIPEDKEHFEGQDHIR